MVSVIIPVYNGAKYLAEAINSVLEQTYQDWELVIVDDGSKDKSLEIAQGYAAGDKRINVFYHAGNINAGVSATRNLGLRHSKGDYIALLDVDDSWYMDKLEIQISCFNQSATTVVVYSQLETVFEVPNAKFPVICGSGDPGLNKEFYKDLLKWNSGWIPNSSIVFKKNLLEKTGLFKEGLRYQIEDSIFFTLLACYGDCYFLNRILGSYRIHDSSYTHNVDWEKSYHEYYQSLLFSKSMKRKDLVLYWYWKNFLKKGI